MLVQILADQMEESQRRGGPHSHEWAFLLNRLEWKANHQRVCVPGSYISVVLPCEEFPKIPTPSNPLVFAPGDRCADG